MTGYRFKATLLLLILVTLTGCSSVMVSSKLPDGFTIKEVSKTDLNTPFAVSKTGAYATILDGKLKVLENGATRDFSQGAAALLCFSPDGNNLAASFPVTGKPPAADKSVLRIFDRSGSLVGETTIPARVTSIAWKSNGQLLASSVSMKRFSFGSGLTSLLYTWDGKTSPVATTLNDTTVRPAVAKLPEDTLYGSLHFSVSPYGDEIAYSTLKDPPLFNPYLRIATRHLETGAERDIGVTSLGSGAPLYTPDGESLLVPSSNGLTRRLTIPDGKEVNAWPSPGDYPAISPSGAYLFLDGRLFEDMREIAWFPKESKAAFLADGTGMAISYMDKVYLVSGLNDGPAPPPPSDMARLLQLRRLRSQGLITEKEYREQRNRIPVQKESVPTR